MRPYLTHEHPLRFAHRGSRVLWPENTMDAFQGAVDLGYRYMEIDVHVSRDGRMVVFHDDGLERLTNGEGKVWEHDWAYLAGLDAAYRFDPVRGYPSRGTGIGIPLFADAVAAFPDALWNLDLKQVGIEQTVAAEIARLGIEERVLVGSFHDSRVERFRKVARGRVATSAGPREVVAALAAARAGRSPRGAADAYQVPEKGGPLRVVTPRFIRGAHRAGKQVHVWTVNDSRDMRRLLALGVDGIITDRPDILNRVLAEEEER